MIAWTTTFAIAFLVGVLAALRRPVGVAVWVRFGDHWSHRPWWKVVINAALRRLQPRHPRPFVIATVSVLPTLPRSARTSRDGSASAAGDMSVEYSGDATPTSRSDRNQVPVTPAGVPRLVTAPAGSRAVTPRVLGYRLCRVRHLDRPELGAQ